MTICKETNTEIIHEEGAIEIICNVFRAFHPDMIIELGTGLGTLTWMLSQTFKDIEIYTFEKNNPEYGLAIKRTSYPDNVHFCTGDLLTEALPLLVSILKLKGSKILYCDNGNKTMEVELYAKHLKAGDMLGVHDYLTEVVPKNIEKYLKAFYPVNHKLFEQRGLSTRLWLKE